MNARRLLVALVALALVPATANAAAQTISDPADVSPGAADALSDVRSASVDQSGQDTAITLAMQADKLGDATPYQADVLIDTNGDARADFDLEFTHDAKLPSSVSYELRSAPVSSATCQQTVGGKALADGTAPQTTASGTGFLTSTVIVPTSGLGGAQGFAWAVFGDTAESAPPDGWDYAPDAANPDPGGPDPGDRTCGLDKSGDAGVLLDLAKGSVLPPPPPPPSALAAQLAVTTGAPSAAQPVGLSAAGSTSALPIIAYDWDFNGDGHIDTSTGTSPLAHPMLAPGVHTVTVTVVDASGERSTASSSFDVSGSTITTLNPGVSAAAGCAQELDLHQLQLAGGCIHPRSEGDGFTITGDHLDVNGTELLTSSGRSEQFELIVNGGSARLSGPAVHVELTDTPIGDMVLGGLDLAHNPLVLDGIATARATARAADADSPGTRLVTFAAGHDCPPPSGRTACATLPGNFPLGGQINVYVDGRERSIFDMQVALDLPSIGFNATGGLRVVASLTTGIQLDSLRFGVPSANLSIFRVSDASFVYHFPDDSDPSSRDSWQAQAKLSFGPVGGLNIDGELDVRDGVFHHASLTLTLPPGVGVPIMPGVLLNRLGGEAGVDPLVFGGTLGASIGSQLEASVSFRYREPTPTELGLFGLQGTLELSGSQIAQLAFDLYTDGYIDGSLDIDLHFPLTADEEHRVVQVDGHIGFWDEPSSGRYQGEGSVHLKVWVIDAAVAGLVNNDWVAGCASFAIGGAAGGYHLADHSVDGFVFVGSCRDEDRLSRYEIAPTTTHSGGFVGRASGAGRPLALPGDTPQEELRLTGAGGAVPVVTLTAPDGRSITTSADVAHVTGHAAQGGAPGFLSAKGPRPGQLLIALDHPSGGVWHVAAAPGAPTVTKVEIARVLPAPRIAAHVRRAAHGRRALVYRIANLAGARVRFVARGADSAQVLGTGAGTSGRITFTPADARGRRRRIEAEITAPGGLPMATQRVATYVAPRALRPGRPGRIRIRRSGLHAVVTWGVARGARGYSLTVRGSDGRVVQFFTGIRKRRVVVHAVLPFQRLHASVVADGAAGDRPGRAATAVLRPRRR